MANRDYFGLRYSVLGAICLVVITALALGVVPTTIIGAMTICMVLGLVFGLIGDNLPIWKDYLGGGAIFAYFAAAFLVKWGLLQPKYYDSVKNFIGGYDFLTVFISVLIAGSIMSVNRKLLMKSILGYIPAILLGVAGAMVVGVLGGWLVGVDSGRTLSMYVLPIMGGGTGAGALPMSEMFAATTGLDKADFLSFAMPILAIGNVFAILAAAVLNKVGERFPSLSGNGELVRATPESSTGEKTDSPAIGLDEVGMGLLVVFGLYMASAIVSRSILPTIGGVQIHTYAYMVFITALCNVFRVFSPRTIAGLQRLQRFFSSQLLFIIMFSCGVAYIDIDRVLGALSLANVFIALCVVIGCILGSGAMAFIVRFYPIETAITAGLCMANTGGTGDIAVLGACKRMNLMSFAQISSRIGGGIMLVIASIVFAVYL